MAETPDTVNRDCHRRYCGIIDAEGESNSLVLLRPMPNLLNATRVGGDVAILGFMFSGLL